MNVITAPRPLRVLLGWPEPAVRVLWERLREQGPTFVQATYAGVAQWSSYLAEVDYYHALCLTPTQWRALQPVGQQRFAARVNLLVLGPEPAAPVDLSAATAAVYVARELPIDDVIIALAELLARLAQGRPLSHCLVESEGQLGGIGLDECWPAPPASVESPSLPLTVTSGPSLSLATGVGNIEVKGDVVGGNKVMIQTTGDQIITGGVQAAKIVQVAGGDQVNVNRFSSDVATEITQTAGGDQVNTNTIAQASAAQPEIICSKCSAVMQVGDTYCLKCGALR